MKDKSGHVLLSLYQHETLSPSSLNHPAQSHDDNLLLSPSSSVQSLSCTLTLIYLYLDNTQVYLIDVQIYATYASVTFDVHNHVDVILKATKYYLFLDAWSKNEHLSVQPASQLQIEVKVSTLVANEGTTRSHRQARGFQRMTIFGGPYMVFHPHSATCCHFGALIMTKDSCNH